LQALANIDRIKIKEVIVESRLIKRLAAGLVPPEKDWYGLNPDIFSSFLLMIGHAERSEASPPGRAGLFGREKRSLG
jgi:hypothetical protein